jgi:hypothetical protein
MPVVKARLAVTAQVYVDSVSAWIPSVAGPAERGARHKVQLWPELRFP